MPSSDCTSLVLGTAQLGFDYGIANATGKPNQQEANDIVRAAWENGIRQFDTAQAYGASETALGAALAAIPTATASARIISKFDPTLDHLDEKAMQTALRLSLQRLGVTKLFGVLLHHEKSLSLWDNGLREILGAFVTAGTVEHIGVSVYSLEGARFALEQDDIDMIQIPFNLLDRRFKQSGIYDLALRKEKQVFVRSIFLQGLLLMEPKDIVDKMSFARSAIQRVAALAHDVKLSRSDLALGFVQQAMPQALVLFGAESAVQVEQNIASWMNKNLPDLLTPVGRDFSTIDEMIIRPDLWPN